jgi:short-subunit dehydrogenase
VNPYSAALAVVTGASSGIGEAISRKLAERRTPLLLVARSAEKLASLAADWRALFGGPVETLALDLAQPGSAATLFEKTEGAGRRVDLLVNNAGFGLNGPEADLSLPRVLELLHLNVVATAELTHRFLVAMRARRAGGILNVSSTAGFIPLPYMAVYGASKAFVLSFTHAVHEEAKRDGVTVSCLCPGYTKTNFHAVAGMKGAEATPFPEMTPGAVAGIGLRALEKEKAVAVTHILDRLWIVSGRLVPRTIPPKIAAAVFARTRLPR